MIKFTSIVLSLLLSLLAKPKVSFACEITKTIKVPGKVTYELLRFHDNSGKKQAHAHQLSINYRETIQHDMSTVREYIKKEVSQQAFMKNFVKNVGTSNSLSMGFTVGPVNIGASTSTTVGKTSSGGNTFTSLNHQLSKHGSAASKTWTQQIHIVDSLTCSVGSKCGCYQRVIEMFGSKFKTNAFYCVTNGVPPAESTFDQQLKVTIQLPQKIQYPAEHYGWIESHAGKWANHYEEKFCNMPFGYVCGARLSIEPPQGRGDDTAADGFMMRCCTQEDPYKSPTEITVEGGNAWGVWQKSVDCPAGSYVWGLRVRFESPQGRGDDTGLNGVEFKCRPLPGSNGKWAEINIHSGYWGHWHNWATCQEHQYVCGVNTGKEKYRSNNDDTALNFVKLK
eukprot:g8976.t1